MWQYDGASKMVPFLKGIVFCWCAALVMYVSSLGTTLPVIYMDYVQMQDLFKLDRYSQCMVEN